MDVKSSGLALTLDLPEGETDAPLGSRELEPEALALQPGQGSFELFQSRVTLTSEGVASAKASFPRTTEGLDPWGTGEVPGLPPDCRAGVFQLEGRLETGASATVPTAAA